MGRWGRYGEIRGDSPGRVFYESYHGYHGYEGTRSCGKAQLDGAVKTYRTAEGEAVKAAESEEGTEAEAASSASGVGRTSSYVHLPTVTTSSVEEPRERKLP